MNTKDYIQIGIFNALFLAIFVLISISVGMIPGVGLLSPVAIAFVGAIPYVILTVKVAKPGVFLVSAFVQNLLLLLLFGFNPFMLMFILVALSGAIIAELLVRANKFQSRYVTGAGYTIYLSSMTLGFLGPVYIWMDVFRSTYGDLEVLKTISLGFVLICTLLTALAAAFGFIIGERMLKKQLKGFL